MAKATDKQLGLIAKLLSERVFTVEVNADSLSIAQASALIDALFNAPKRATAKTAKDTAEPVAEGIYRTTDGTVYRVVTSEAGNRYAKRLRESGRGFDYAQGAIRNLTAGDRLTLEQAAALGLQFGACVVCGRELSDPDSVAMGIGPVCAANDIWSW